MEVEYQNDPPFELSFEKRLRELCAAIKENTERMEKLAQAIAQLVEEVQK